MSALHPELRARLQKLGDGEEDLPNESRQPMVDKGGLDTEVDRLLQQLEDLDSRSLALQQMDRKDHSRWRKDDEVRAQSFPGNRPGQDSLQHPLDAGLDRSSLRRKTPHLAKLQRTPSSAGNGRSAAVAALPPLLKASASAPCLTRPRGNSFRLAPEH
ncbi:unnamed protein product [Cladocopium goreaui]|uniref:Uncharacterized protein n=1 Tax=Cladocopium goreaui TaxID=2562237 RepID=A0A9P1M0M1_9DINO|nr:unnamed protein product [Cladocopium goreaui]|mmetsp:Transcript_9639/g.21429  ORF Transcript_9639/g.21429 Transcript_9639/m.21429 type:complete len:158 (+) Transcript_9639:41-514(+)